MIRCNFYGQVGIGDPANVGTYIGTIGVDIPYLIGLETSSPSLSPTVDPTQNPTSAPTLPTTRPTLSPSLSPTLTPTLAPSATPSLPPTNAPSNAPTDTPLSLKEVMEMSVDGKTLDTLANFVLYIVIGGAILMVVIEIIYTALKAKSQTTMTVDDQKYISVMGYMAQIVDICSDFAFALQCRAYWHHVEDDVEFKVSVKPIVFKYLYHLALFFVVAPYALNLGSSLSITKKIVGNDSISEHSKQYFRAKSKVYTILVLLSGGAFPALKLMSSNLFGLGLFSSGLSTIQLNHFRSTHVVATVMLENIPQLALQYFFMFQLKLFTITVVASFISSIFNIVMAIMTSAVFWILHRDQTETPFVLSISWKLRKGLKSKSDLNPAAHCGLRKKLQKLMGQITVNGKALKFEVLSTVQQHLSCVLYGVFVSEHSLQSKVRAMSGGSDFDEFLKRKKAIRRAVLEAFGLDAEFQKRFDFKVSVSSASKTSPKEMFGLAMRALQYFDVPQDLVSGTSDHIESVLRQRELAQKEETANQDEPAGAEPKATEMVRVQSSSPRDDSILEMESPMSAEGGDDEPGQSTMTTVFVHYVLSVFGLNVHCSLSYRVVAS